MWSYCGQANICMLIDREVLKDGWGLFNYFVDELDALVAVANNKETAMTRISPMDLSFLLLEKANRPFHMAAFTIFQKPKGQQSSFGPRLFDAYRHSQAVKPFNYKLKWLGKDVAAWETVEPDMRYHVRHIDLPAPGSMQQFYETVSFLNTEPARPGTPALGVLHHRRYREWPYRCHAQSAPLANRR